MKIKMMASLLAAAVSLHGQSDARLVDLRSLLQSIANTSDESAVPRPEALAARLDAVEQVLKNAPAGDIGPLVSIAAGCLNSALPSVRKDCLSALAPIATLRFDSATLLSPHLARITALLDDDTPSIRAMTAFVLAAMHPNPPAELMDIVAPRVEDPQRSAYEVSNLIAVLLAIDSKSMPVITEILKVTKLRADRAITGRVLERFGALRCSSELVLSFIGESLNSADAGIRLAAVASLLPQDRAVVRRFQPKLTQIAANPDEDRRIRASAQEALRSVR